MAGSVCPRTTWTYGRIARPTEHEHRQHDGQPGEHAPERRQDDVLAREPLEAQLKAHTRRTRARAAGNASGASSAVAAPNPAAHSPIRCSCADTVAR